jgi:hypothetical protein
MRSSDNDKQHVFCDWLSSSLKRRTLSIRTPRATCLGRATNFNKHNVMFFADLSKVYDRYKFQCKYIYNVDETVVTDV